MLQITECNIRLKLGIQKKHGLLIMIERHGRPQRGEDGHSLPFWKMGLRTDYF